VWLITRKDQLSISFSRKNPNCFLKFPNLKEKMHEHIKIARLGALGGATDSGGVHLLPMLQAFNSATYKSLMGDLILLIPDSAAYM
jgi:hypothetical protein